MKKPMAFPSTPDWNTGLDAKFVDILTGKRCASFKSYMGGGVPDAKELSMSDYEVLELNQRLSSEAVRKLGVDVFRVSDYWLWPKGYHPIYIDQHTLVDWWCKVYWRALKRRSRP